VAGVYVPLSQESSYNPISYQLGSVWPQLFIAAGLKRYGYHPANRVAEGIFAAASYFEAGRMPELLLELNASRKAFLFLMPMFRHGRLAQFSLIRTILGLEANAPQRKLRVRPTLPEWLPWN